MDPSLTVELVLPNLKRQRIINATLSKLFEQDVLVFMKHEYYSAEEPDVVLRFALPQQQSCILKLRTTHCHRQVPRGSSSLLDVFP
jgi:hypothetical protein